MSWITFTLLAAGFQSFVYLFSKYILANENHDYYLAAFSWSILASIAFPLIGIQVGPISYDPFLICAGIFIGWLYCLAFFTEFKGLRSTDVSKYVPLQSLSPVFVLFYATIFFNEILHPQNYLGIILIIIGVSITSLKRRYKGKKRGLEFDGKMLIPVLAALLFAIKNIFTKYISFDISIFSVMPWIGLGTAIASLYIFLFHRPHLRTSLQRKGFEHFFWVALSAVLGAVTFTIAINSGPVSLVSFLDKIQIVFLFALAMILDWLKPKFLREKFSRQIFIKKLISVFFVLIGSFLLSF
jgi:drug/metabolite transporter (DMT)-like permease